MLIQKYLEDSLNHRHTKHYRKMELVVAIAKNGVIGNGPHSLPWSIPEDLQHFKEITEGHVVVMGHNTYKSLKAPLKNRINIVITSKTPDHFLAAHTEFVTIENLDTKMDEIRNTWPDKKIYLIGGAKLYAACEKYCTKMHVTHIDKAVCTGPADHPVYFEMPAHFVITAHEERRWSESEQCHYQFITYERRGKLYSPTTNEGLHSQSLVMPYRHNDTKYADLVNDVMTHGTCRPDRTGTGTLSVFGRQLRFDLDGRIPLLTTKYVPWKSVIKELLWFLRGQTDAGLLKAQGVGIWDGNTTREFLDARGLTHLPAGDIGCGYGFQWRHFGAAYGTCKDTYGAAAGYDQVAAVLHQLRTDPYSRRIYMTAWNAAAIDSMALPPCHVSAQFYVAVDPVDGTKLLSCHMYQRSVDVFLGLPFNIFSYAALTYLFAAMCDMKPHELIISTGDTHIYSDHLEQMQRQCEREPMMSPALFVNPGVKNKTIDEVVLEDFDVIGYFHHAVLRGKMAV